MFKEKFACALSIVMLVVLGVLTLFYGVVQSIPFEHLTIFWVVAIGINLVLMFPLRWAVLQVIALPYTLMVMGYLHGGWAGSVAELSLLGESLQAGLELLADDQS